SGEELAVAIEASPGVALPDGLRGYLCRFLRGKVKRKRGPKGLEREFRFVIELLATEEYQKELRRLQKERKFRGREAIGKGQLSPHEEATAGLFRLPLVPEIYAPFEAREAPFD